jgi:hypothetical protein
VLIKQRQMRNFNSNGMAILSQTALTQSLVNLFSIASSHSGIAGANKLLAHEL